MVAEEVAEAVVVVVPVGVSWLVAAWVVQDFEVQVVVLDLVNFPGGHQILQVCRPRSVAPSSRGKEEGASFQELV